MRSYILEKVPNNVQKKLRLNGIKVAVRKSGVLIETSKQNHL